VTRLLHVTTVPMSLTFLEGHVDFMRARGFDFHALSSPGPELDDFGARHEVPTYRVEMPRRVTPFRDLRGVTRMTRILRRVRPDIVHAHTPKGGLLGMIAASAAGVSVRIYHMRGLPLMAASGWKRALLRRTERVACSLAHRVLCVSDSVRRVAVDEGLCPPEKIAVLANGSGQGVDAVDRFDPARVGPDARPATRARFGIPQDARVLGFVGRLVRENGLLELEEAWRALREAFDDLHLLLVGPWEPQDPVPADVRERLERDRRVHLTGLDWNTPPLYGAMDIVALPTYREGFPNVPLEAAAMELPVIATRVPGCVDAVEEGETGLLVPPRDADALADAIRSYLEEPELRRAHGRAGRIRVLRDFRPQDIYEALYREYVGFLGAEASAPRSHPTARPVGRVGQ